MTRRQVTLIAMGLLAVVALGVYAWSLDFPFWFDDFEALHQNPTIRHLTDLTSVFQPPRESPVAARPLVNFTFAVNYALGGLSPRGYRLVNILLHICNAGLIFAIVRRSLGRAGCRTTDAPPHSTGDQTPGLRAGVGPGAGERSQSPAARADILALIVALLWVVHPLQTDSVVYVTQRTELLTALFLLLTLYAAIRSWTDGPARRARNWAIVAVACCAAGMLCKEVMVVAPVVVLLYDRCLFRGSWGRALQRSWPMYVGLALTWVPLLLLVWSNPRSRSAGLGMGVGPWQYLQTQAGVILWYLKLSLLPGGQQVHYEWPIVEHFAQALPAGLVVLAVLGLSGWALWRRPGLGFLGAFVFILLAPTSSVVPIVTEVAAERRMYLPLAALLTLVVLAADYGLRWVLQATAPAGSPPGSPPPLEAAAPAAVAAPVAGQGESPGPWIAAVVGLIVVGLAVGTVLRQRVYRSDEALWTDVVTKEPHNWRAWNNLGLAHLGAASALPRGEAQWQRQRDQALKAFNRSLAAKRNSDAWTNLGVLWLRGKSYSRSEEAFRNALLLDPTNYTARANLGWVMLDRGEVQRARGEFEQAVRDRAEYANAWAGVGVCLAQEGRVEEGLGQLRRAVELRPEEAEPRRRFADVLRQAGRVDEAIAEYRRTIEHDRTNVEAQAALGELLLERGEAEEAAVRLAQAVLLRPREAQHLTNVGRAALRLGYLDQARDALRQALALDTQEGRETDNVPALRTLAEVLEKEGRPDEALKLRTQADALEASPAHWERLGLRAAGRGDVHQAVALYQRGLALDPKRASTWFVLGNARAMQNRMEDAAEALQTALTLKPDHADASFNLANAYTALGRAADALAQLEATVRLDPRHAGAQNNLGIALARAGRLPEAVRHFTEALRIAPDFADARFNLDKARRQLGWPATSLGPATASAPAATATAPASAPADPAAPPATAGAPR